MSPADRPPVAVLARHLPVLLARLRAARYAVGPGELVDLQRLLARAACLGRGPLPAPELARVVAPLVCRSATEQQAFGDHFEAWLAELPSLSRQAAEHGSRERPAKQATAPTAPTAPAPRAGAWRLVAVLVAVVVLAFLVRWWVLVTFLPAETSPGMRARAVAARTVVRPRPAAPGPRVVRPSSDPPLWPLAFAASLWLVPLYYAWLYGGLLPAWLRRRSAGRLPELDRLSLGRTIRPLGAAWRGIRSLCDRDPRPDPGLQVEASVRATVSQGGYFTPVYGHRPELPEYLALIDRRSPEDHLARFADELMARIEERGLATRTLFFRRDPRPGLGGPGRGFSSLEALSGQARAERLLIFSDADSWLDPRSGRPWPRLESLTRWRQRFLLTPRPEPEWGRREQALATSGLAPFPLSDQGLVALAEGDAARVARPAPTAVPEAAAPGDGSVTRSLNQDADRWLDDASPEPGEARQLLAALKDRLTPDEVRWLSACAVFPAVSWPVTCTLGQCLMDDDGQPLFTEERLLQLARLPWFRYGKMPDWLRLELIDAMDRDQRERVRESLRALLAEATRASKPGSEPEIAQVAGWRSERQLSRWLSRQGADSPLRDYLFLSFMRDRRPSRLILAAPLRLRALIRDADRWSVLASALLALAWTLVISVWHRLESVPVGSAVPLGDGMRAIPMPAPAGFAEAAIVAAVLMLSVLGVGLSGLKHRRQAPAAAEAAVPDLIARIAARRLPVLAPLIATIWVGAFIVADFAGSPAGLRWTAAHLFATFTAVLYFYLELGFASHFRRRLDRLEARLEAGAGDEVVGDVVAFLRGRAATDMKRRLLRLIHARVREPPAALVRELFELRHSGVLEPRTKSLLERVSRQLEDRYRGRLERREAA